MLGYVANTDNDWFEFLSARPHLEEVNFWRPGKQAFRSVPRGAPLFFKPDEWVELPSDFAANIVSGKNYDLSEGEGKRIWEQCLARYAAGSDPELWVPQALEQARTGKPQLIEPRLGQASFRIDVQRAYQGQCAVTTEHSLPVLEAAHIKPWSNGGENVVSNGLFLRSDLHRLFDRGYVTVDNTHRLVVSPALREEWQNGKAYYELHGRQLAIPKDPHLAPSAGHLEWHREEVFVG